MADRGLTLEEFRSLSTEKEKCERYVELSDHDKFLVRISMPPGSAIWIPCNDCVYRIGKTPSCKAYPEGLSGDHIRAVMEDQAIECGNGFKFLPKE